jgi:hypothetical protein
MATKVPRKPARAGQRVGRYLYAVIDTGEEKECGTSGIDGGRVYTIGNGQVAAVVSDLPEGKIRPERRKLAAHHEVLKRLMASHTVLPMAFGIVADGAEAIRKILSGNRAEFAAGLRRVAGKVEMGVRVVWDVPNIFEFFVNTHAELRLLRDRLFRGSREPTQEEKLEVGRLFDRTLVHERQALTERVVGVLGPLCFEVKENKPRNEQDVMNLACLIGRDAQKEFEGGIFEAARFFDNHYAFDFNGPWPPHNFVEVTLQM